MTLILVTDDSSFQRRIVTGILQKEGYEFIEAVNGKDALEKIEKNNFDLILLDLLMPEIDGFGVLKELIKKHSKTPVVILTSDIQDTTRSMCEELGVAGFVNKPADEKVLLPLIKKTLGN